MKISRATLAGAGLALASLACSSTGAETSPGGDGATQPTSLPSVPAATTSDAMGSSGSSAAGAEESCAAPQPGPAPMRRLSNAEYRNTLVDLLGDAEVVDRAIEGFPRETTSLGFRNAASALTVSALVADGYVNAARALAPAVASNSAWNACAPTDIASECARAFSEKFGALAYRRPLLSSELESYSRLYATVINETNDFDAALEWIAAAMLSSPHFLFRVELSAAPSGGAARPTGYEMASRLSYLLWQSMPDEALFAAAAAGDLETQAGIDAQIKRMAGDPRALRVYEFFEQWLDIDEAQGFTRSDVLYPSFDGRLVELLQAENRAFVYHLLTTDGTFADLLAADFTFANRELAEHYGLEQVPQGAAFERVDAPARAGVLTQATMLMHDRPARTSIVKRGLKLRTDFFCQIVPAPPANVDTNLPELDGNLTQKERLAQHRENPSCQGCHQLMDPLGSIFEGFDALGRPRTADEGGALVEPGGSVTGLPSLDGDYASPRDLALKMAEDDQIRSCFALQAFRFFYGRDKTAADECTQAQLMASFSRDGYRLVDLLVGLARTDQFLYRQGDQP